MAKRIIDLFFTAMVLVGSVYLWRVADKFPTFAKYKNVDSAFWPQIILVSMGILSVAILYENIVALRLERSKKAKASGRERGAAPSVNWHKMVLMGLLCIAYYWGLSSPGFRPGHDRLYVAGHGDHRGGEEDHGDHFPHYLHGCPGGRVREAPGIVPAQGAWGFFTSSVCFSISDGRRP